VLQNLLTLGTGEVIARAMHAVAFLLLARAIVAWSRSDLDGLFRVIGSKSALEEAKEEVVAVEHGLEAEHKQ